MRSRCHHAEGQLIREGTVAELTAQRGVFVIGVLEQDRFPESELRQKGFNLRAMGERWEITLTDVQTITPVLELIRAKNLNVVHMIEKKQTLEDIFVSMVEASEPGVDARRKKRAADRDDYDRDHDRRGDRR